MLPLRLPVAVAAVTPQEEVEDIEVEVGGEEVAEKEGVTIRAGGRGRELRKGWESSSQKLLDSSTE